MLCLVAIGNRVRLCVARVRWSSGGLAMWPVRFTVSGPPPHGPMPLCRIPFPSLPCPPPTHDCGSLGVAQRREGPSRHCDGGPRPGPRTASPEDPDWGLWGGCLTSSIRAEDADRGNERGGLPSFSNGPDSRGCLIQWIPSMADNPPTSGVVREGTAAFFLKKKISKLRGGVAVRKIPQNSANLAFRKFERAFSL